MKFIYEASDDRTIKLREYNGVQIADFIVEQYIEDVVNYLEENPEEHITHIMSGDSIIIGSRDIDSAEIQIVVATPRLTGYTQDYTV